MTKENKSLIFGKVISICSSDIWVEVEKEVYACVIKGSLKKERLSTDNLVAVGDNVRIRRAGSYTGIIEEIEPRYSSLSRGVVRNKHHVMVANVDFVLIVMAVDSFSANLIDRYIVMSLKGNIVPIIIINKWDLPIADEDKQEIEKAIKYYRNLGLSVFETSCMTQNNIAELKKVTKNKTSMFLGQSGVGKTSLFNRLTGKNYSTQKVNEKTGKGLHTTTRSVLITTPEAWYVDSPGIRMFSLHAITPKDLQNFFVEIVEKSQLCRYSSCSHKHEPECAVKMAVEEGSISQQRLDSYYILLDELQMKTKRRERTFISQQKKRD